MRRPIPTLLLGAAGGALLALAARGGLAIAQQRPADAQARPADAQQRPADAQARPADAQARPADARGDGLALIYPTGDRATSSLLVEAITPGEVVVGQNYQYTIRLTNLTRNLVLEDVEVSQHIPENFSIESSEPEANGEGDEDGMSWSVDRLAPGESKEIRVTALGDQEGVAQACIRVKYEPTLCVATRFIKPELQVSKAAPEEADICRPIELRYTVKNTGSGVARNVIVTDELPEGLTAAEGGRMVRLEAGDLQPDQARDFAVRVNATQTGEFGSRAQAVAANDLEARSNRPETRIVAASLSAGIQGPSAQYVGQPMTYRTVIRNEGEGPAVDARLTIDIDENSRLLQTSKSDPEGVAPKQSGRSLVWDFGAIEPGGERAVSFTVTTGREVELQHVARATSVCAVGGDIAEALTATETVTTTMLTLPALVLELVDVNDPVEVGGEEIYRIAVRNQGSGADENVKIVVELPEQFEFVSARGRTQARAEGQTVTFEPIESLAPGERALWEMVVRARDAGDVRTKVELTSEYLSSDSPGVSIEPTRILEGGRPDPEADRNDD